MPERSSARAARRVVTSVLIHGDTRNPRHVGTRRGGRDVPSSSVSCRLAAGNAKGTHAGCSGSREAPRRVAHPCAVHSGPTAALGTLAPVRLSVGSELRSCLGCFGAARRTAMAVLRRRRGHRERRRRKVAASMRHLSPVGAAAGMVGCSQLRRVELARARHTAVPVIRLRIKLCRQRWAATVMATPASSGAPW